ncbi:IS110 family transposase [Rubritalea tangerina]|uniref:IS110 family transposase n=1 Tax=Rubritalea tangerina TaxID=430798 RepID=UPI0036237682
MKKKPKQATIVGVDLSDKKHQICVLDKNGEILSERTIPNSYAGLDKLSADYPEALIAMEVGTHSPWISNYLKEKGHKVIVANARKLRAIYCNERKSDKRDAQMIAKLARVDTSLLYPIEHGSVENLENRQRLAMRDTLVKHRVALINSVRFSLKSLGLRLSSPSSASFSSYARKVLCAQPSKLQLVESMLVVIEAMSNQIKQADRHIKEQMVTVLPESKRLMQIPGVGALSAVSFVLTIDDPWRFKDPRDVAAYLGLVPKRDQSGEIDKQLPISKAGNRQMRTLLVQCAQYIMRSNSPDCDLKRHGERIAARGGRIAKRKAIVAVARKLSVTMLTIWQRQIEYQPLVAIKANAV